MPLRYGCCKPEKQGLVILFKNGGVELALHRASPALVLPWAGLTSEFEMGSGVAPPLLTPPNLWGDLSRQNNGRDRCSTELKPTHASEAQGSMNRKE